MSVESRQPIPDRRRMLRGAGLAAVTKAHVALTAGSLVLVTLQQNLPGIYVASAVPNTAAGSFAVHLNKATPKAARVAWFIVN